MNKRKSTYTCPNQGCSKLFKQEGMNDENFQRHLDNCQHRKKILKSRGDITAYFSLQGAATGSHDGDDNIVFETGSGNYSHGSTNVSYDTETINAELGVEKGEKCNGLEVSMQSGPVLSHYPFHRHESSDITLKLPFNISLCHNNEITSLVAHSKDCSGTLKSGFNNMDGNGVNKVCADIEYSPALKKLIEVGDSTEPNDNLKLEMLSFNQLLKRYRQLKGKLQCEKLSTLNITRKNNTLIYQQTLITRFRELIASADIPRLGTLLQICHTKGMGMQSIIGRIHDALNEKYKLKKYGEDEWDIAYLVLRIGGPRLLHILHSTHGLPAVKSVQSYSSETDAYIAAGVDISFVDRLENNSTRCNQHPNSISTLKMDEIATESRLRWCNKDNKILGLCYQHSHDVKMNFKTMEDALVIRDLIESGHIHKTKETLVVASGVVGNGAKIQTILTLPSCSKTESNQFTDMINSTSKVLNPDIIATDGDAMRRKIFNSRDKLVQDKNVRAELEKLPLFDLYIIDGLRALYFDDKHNAKRLRGVIISDTRGCMVGRNIVSNSQLKYMFNSADIRNAKEILNPKDRQNVPAVLNLVESLNKCATYHQYSDDQVCRELLDSLKILVKIFEGILCIFSSPTIHLRDQLQKLSTLSHILYHQYREHGTSFVPGQLYHDLQRMIQASYFACSLLKSRGGGKIYLYQMGTDQLEKLFGSVRTITHARNCDALELCQRLQHAEVINEIITKHPAWKGLHGKRLSSYNDATSQVDWTGEIDVTDIDLHQQWILGRGDACKVLNINPTFFSSTPGYSMLRPNKRAVGVTVDNEREETRDMVSNINTNYDDSEGNESVSTVVEAEENEISLDIEEFLEEISPSSFNSTVDVEGKLKHKATVIREMFNETGSSVDRLRRVRAYSKFINSKSDEVNDNDDIELDSMIMLGDSVCGKVALLDGSASLCIGKIKSIRDLTDKTFKTISPLAKIGDLQFQVSVFHGSVTNDILILKDLNSTTLITWKGSLSVIIDLRGMCLEMKNAISMMASLPLADERPVKLNGVPYDPLLKEVKESTVSSEKTLNILTCRLCGESVEMKIMRKHIGKHILQDKLEKVCGFCGLEGCSIDLVTGSGRGKSATLTTASDCTYKTKFSLKAAENSTKTGPCTNRPIRCELCKLIKWSYNLPKHFEDKHSDYPTPITVKEVEYQRMGLK